MFFVVIFPLVLTSRLAGLRFYLVSHIQLLSSHQVSIVLEKGVNFPSLCVKEVCFLQGEHCIFCPSWLPFLTDTEAAGQWPVSLGGIPLLYEQRSE